MYHAIPSRGRTILLVLFILLFALVPAASAASFSHITPTPTIDPSLIIVKPVHTIAIITTTQTEAPQTGYIAISSTPSGASVTIDGIVAGTTPFTSRTLTPGSHSLLLQMAGYQEYRTTFEVLPDSTNKVSYTLIPVTITTVTTPAETRVPLVTTTALPVTTPATTIDTATTLTETRAPLVTTAAPMVTTPTSTPTIARPQGTIAPTDSTSLAAELQEIGPVTVRPIVIRAGNHSKSPILDTTSPWFQQQFDSSNVIGIGKSYSLPTDIIPGNFIEVDQHNVYLPSSGLMSSADMTVDPFWGDEDTVYIKSDAKFYNKTNFRWIALNDDATAVYQVSRFPFTTNASHWQNQYVTGLVASGPAKDVYVDGEGFHYFSLNFAPIANHDPSKPPIYTGFTKLEPTLPGQGKPLGLFEIPFTESGIWYKKKIAGPVAVPFPDSLASVPPGTFTETDLASPNDNMLFTDPDYPVFQPSTDLMDSFLDRDQVFYVRIVPILKSGSAGIPTLPVTVTVKRPHPCPTDMSSGITTSVIVKPPSAEIKSFYMNLIVPDWIHTDQNGALVSRAHFVTVVSPPYCQAASTGNSMIDSTNAQYCSMYGGSEPNYHFYADPAESHWYDTVWDIITGLFSALSSVVNSVSAAWNQINNLVVQIAAYAVQGLTFGAFDCNASPACTGLLHAALSAAESALGIPPTIPNFSDLESMGADYLAKVAAEQVGAGGALDAAQSAYDAMPESVKDTIKDHADEVGDSLGDSVASQSGVTVASAAGNWYIPDPLYYKPHPAMVFVRVSNPNNQATDMAWMSVSDTGGFFKKADVIIPPLKAYDSTVVPMILTEDYSRVYKPGCNNQEWITTNGIPCYWENWNQAARKAGTDTFVISLSVRKDGQWISQLTPSSSGTVLSTQNIVSFDEEGKSCPGYTSTSVLEYPSGWTMKQDGWSQNLDSVMWNAYTFTNGASGRLIGE